MMVIICTGEHLNEYVMYSGFSGKTLPPSVHESLHEQLIVNLPVLQPLLGAFAGSAEAGASG